MKIFINPGHAEDGRPDPGAVNPDYGKSGLYEFRIARKIGELAAYYLRYIGEDVKLLQSHNLIGESPGYPCVVKTANDWGADLFLSIHVNAGGGRGCETFYYQDESEGMNFAREVQDELYRTIHDFDPAYRNRGIFARPTLAVLRGTAMPAILVELGFIDNIEDAWLMSFYYNDFARALARGVTNYQCSLGQPIQSSKMDQAIQPI